MCFQLPANVYREINMLKRHKLLNQQHLKLSRAAQELNKDLKQDHKRDNKEKRFSCVNGSLWWRIGYTQLLQCALDFKRLTRLSKSAHLVVFASHVNIACESDTSTLVHRETFGSSAAVTGSWCDEMTLRELPWASYMEYPRNLVV